MSMMATDGESKKGNDNVHSELNHIYFYSEVNRSSVHELIQLIREAEEY